MSVFYTYLWLREDGTPYYVGKGTFKRSGTSHKHRVGCPPRDRNILQQWDTEEEAFFAEKFLIAGYGRKVDGSGCLRNLTLGGEGPSGMKRSPETCQRLSLAHKGKKQSPEHRKNNSESHKGKSHCWGRKYSSESIQKMSDSAWRRYHVFIL